MKPSTLQGFRYLTIIALAMAVAALPFSIKICHASLTIVIISWMLQGNWKEKWDACKTNPIVLAFVVFFLLHVVGMIYTHDKTAGWFDIEKKVVLILLPVVLASSPKFEAKELSVIFRVFIIACIGGTVVCIVHAIRSIMTGSVADPLSSSMFWLMNPHASKNWLAFSYADLASGIDMHPTYLSMYLVFCLLLTYKIYSRDFFTRSRGFQLLLIFLCLYLGSFIIFLSSRITTIVFIALVFAGCYLLDAEERRSKRAIYSLAVAFFFIMIMYVNPVSRYRNFQEVLYSSHLRTDTKPRSLSSDIRTSLWWVGLKSIQEINPLIGAGTGDVEEVMKSTGKKYSVYNILGSNNPHNQYIFTMLGLGLIGLVSLLLCFGLPLYAACLKKDFFYLSFLGLIAFVCLTETILELQKGIVFFAIFNSLLVFQYADWSVTKEDFWFIRKS